MVKKDSGLYSEESSDHAAFWTFSRNGYRWLRMISSATMMCRYTIAESLLLVVLIVSFVSHCETCDLDIQPISCSVNADPLTLDSYNLSCMFFFQNCSSGSVDVSYKMNQGAANSSCECYNKTTKGNSITCTIPDSHPVARCAFGFIYPFQYLFYITDISSQQKKSYCIDPRNAMVSMAQPCPVPDIVVFSATSVDLRWDAIHTNDPACFFTLNGVHLRKLAWCTSYTSVRYIYLISYKMISTTSNHSQKAIEVDCGECTFGDRCSKTCFVKLSDLVPATHYEVEIRRKPYTYKNWNPLQSDTCQHGFSTGYGTSFGIVTNESVPLAGVPTESSGYHTQECTAQCRAVASAARVSGNMPDCCREITIFWKPIPKLLRGGNITEYKILIDNSKMVRTTSASGSSQKMTICDSSGLNTTIRIQPATHVGYGNTSTIAKFAIPSKVHHKQVEDIIVKRLNNSAALLSWKWRHHGDSDTFVAFFCTSFESSCEDINWQAFDTVGRIHETDRLHATLVVLHVLPQNIAIGVSHETQGMGFTIATCFYWNQTQPAAIQLSVDALTSVDASGKTMLHAYWPAMTCSEAGGLIVAYHLHICNGQGNKHTHTCVEHHLTANRTEWTAGDVHPGMHYSVQINAIVHNGTHVVMLHSAVRHVKTKGLGSSEVAGLVAGIALGAVVVVTGLICCIRQLRSCVRTGHVPLVIPAISQALQDASEYSPYVSDTYLLVTDQSRQSLPADTNAQTWKVESESLGTFEDGVSWNSSYPQLNSGNDSCNDDYPLLGSASPRGGHEAASLSAVEGRSAGLFA